MGAVAGSLVLKLRTVGGQSPGWGRGCDWGNAISATLEKRERQFRLLEQFQVLVYHGSNCHGDPTDRLMFPLAWSFLLSRITTVEHSGRTLQFES